jgi:hypothetical protein
MTDKRENYGKQKHTAKGAHGGGTPYQDMSSKFPKYPTFGLGEGLKQRPKPGPSTDNKMPPQK